MQHRGLVSSQPRFKRQTCQIKWKLSFTKQNNIMIVTIYNVPNYEYIKKEIFNYILMFELYVKNVLIAITHQL